ncbi:MAG TPA: GNAT family N-acetyltransferase [Levilinea sp.]|nr:GNAT family N-acetyltransferase [Levilinea sp.]
MIESQIVIRQTSIADRIWMRQFIAEHWGDEKMVVHGTVMYPAELSGFVAEHHGAIVGLVTYQILADACEITSLDSTDAGMGIGSALLETVVWAAIEAGCSRMWLITTNDNLEALDFYQKRGFRLAMIYPGAVDVARMVKPSIPLVGESGIPIHDEIELELVLHGDGYHVKPVLQ